MTHKTRIAAAMLALALLAGCHKEHEDQPIESDNVGAEVQPEPSATPTAEPVSVPTERPEPPVANVAVPVADEPRAPPPSPDAQMLDDADATGMTARMSRQEASQEAQGNDAAP